MLESKVLFFFFVAIYVPYIYNSPFLLRQVCLFSKAEIKLSLRLKKCPGEEAIKTYLIEIRNQSTMSVDVCTWLFSWPINC